MNGERGSKEKVEEDARKNNTSEGPIKSKKRDAEEKKVKARDQGTLEVYKQGVCSTTYR